MLDSLSPVQRPLHVALGVAFFKCLAFIKLTFAFGHGQHHFYIASFKVKLQWNERGTLLFGHPLLKFANFAAMQEQRARAGGVVIELIGLFIFFYMSAHQVNLAIADNGESPRELYAAQPNAFNFAAQQGDAGFNLVKNKVIVVGTPIIYARRLGGIGLALGRRFGICFSAGLLELLWCFSHGTDYIAATRCCKLPCVNLAL